jgi:hypothetical protein
MHGMCNIKFMNGKVHRSHKLRNKYINVARAMKLITSKIQGLSAYALHSQYATLI